VSGPFSLLAMLDLENNLGFSGAIFGLFSWKLPLGISKDPVRRKSRNLGNILADVSKVFTISRLLSMECVPISFLFQKIPKTLNKKKLFLLRTTKILF
jgi:hypothetical protein